MSVEKYISDCESLFSEYIPQQKINVLDIGGGNGNFAMAVKHYFGGKADVYVLDTTAYDTWNNAEFSQNITFIRDSVEHLNTIFPEDFKFDIIFANKVFHHFVSSSYRETLNGMNNYLRMICDLLAPEGTLCIHEHFYNGRIFDASSSLIIYMITSCRIPAIVSLAKRFSAESAGVGVCFQSERMWLKRLHENGFPNVILKRSPYRHLSALKRIVLLSKGYSMNNMMICRKKEVLLLQLKASMNASISSSLVK